MKQLEFGTMSTARSVNVYHHEKNSTFTIILIFIIIKLVLGTDLSIFSGTYNRHCIVGRTP